MAVTTVYLPQKPFHVRHIGHHSIYLFYPLPASEEQREDLVTRAKRIFGDTMPQHRKLGDDNKTPEKEKDAEKPILGKFRVPESFLFIFLSHG